MFVLQISNKQAKKIFSSITIFAYDNWLFVYVDLSVVSDDKVKMRGEVLLL